MAKQHAGITVTTALAAGCAAHSVRNARLEHTPTQRVLPPPTSDVVQHVLARFTFGPSPGAAAEVRRLGVESWFDAQLAAHPNGVAGALTSSPYAHALGQPEDVIAAFSAAHDTNPVDTEQISLRKEARRVNVKELLATVSAAQIQRHVESESQLHAVMVDFWTNHFNVFARKNALKVLAGNYVETAIVPHALGRFEDLLIATARSPAMMVYLDNDKSAAKGTHGRRGLNENYARELLELHTLGVNGGYGQADVIAVARVLTGWGLGDPREQQLDFQFSLTRHDTDEKIALGRHFPSGGGEEEGLALLRFLAHHPATARHIAQKLCQRFISDDPPEGAVTDVAEAFLATQGDVPATLRALLRLPGFWAPSARGSKLKKPSEFLASALRALGLTLDGTPAIAKASVELGEPPLLYPAPTGYPDRASAWAGGSQILARMDTATRLVSGQIRGLSLESLEAVVPVTENHDELVACLDRALFGGQCDEKTRHILREEASRAGSPEEARNTALALALGSPAFQRR